MEERVFWIKMKMLLFSTPLHTKALRPPLPLSSLPSKALLKVDFGLLLTVCHRSSVIVESNDTGAK